MCQMHYLTTPTTVNHFITTSTISLHIKVNLIECKLTVKIILINEQILSNLSTLTVKFILESIVSTKLLESLNLLHITSCTLWSDAIEFSQAKHGARFDECWYPSITVPLYGILNPLYFYNYTTT